MLSQSCVWTGRRCVPNRSQSIARGQTWQSLSQCMKRQNSLIYYLSNLQSINGCDLLPRRINCQPTIYTQQVIQLCYRNFLQKSKRRLNLISNLISFKEPQRFSSSSSLRAKIFFFMYRKTHSALTRAAQPIQL